MTGWLVITISSLSELPASTSCPVCLENINSSAPLVDNGLLNSLLTPYRDGLCCCEIFCLLSPSFYLFSLLYPVLSETNDGFLPLDISRPRINVLFALNEIHGLFCIHFALTLWWCDSHYLALNDFLDSQGGALIMLCGPRRRCWTKAGRQTLSLS